MLCRFSISLILAASISSYAADLNNSKLLPTKTQIQSAQKKFGELNKTDPSKVKQFEKLNNPDLTKMQELFKNQRISGYANLQNTSNAKKTTGIIFYLFSKTVPDYTVKNVFKDSKNIPSRYQFNGVLRGLDKDGLKKLEEWQEISDVTVKINPIIFDEAKVNTVPAFVYAECNTTTPILRTNSCVFKKVLFGDVSLEFALEKMGLL